MTTSVGFLLRPQCMLRTRQAEIARGCDLCVLVPVFGPLGNPPGGLESLERRAGDTSFRTGEAAQYPQGVCDAFSALLMESCVARFPKGGRSVAQAPPLTSPQVVQRAGKE